MFQVDELAQDWQPTGALVKADDYRKLLDADALLAQTREQAERIVAEAQGEFLRQKAAGYETGLEEARHEATNQAVQTAQQLCRHARELESQLVEVVTSAVERIVGELDAHDRIVMLIKTALPEFAGQSKVSVLVHPEQVPALERKLEELRSGQAGLDILDVSSDARVAQDTCVLATQWHVVDASLNVQLEQLRLALTNELTRG